MKKTVSFFLAVIIAISSASAIADKSLQRKYKKMFILRSYEELLELNAVLQDVIMSKSKSPSFTLPPGEYIVGTDIPEGTYTMDVVYPESVGHIIIYSDDTRTDGKINMLGKYSGVLSIGKVGLFEGNIVELTSSTLLVKPYTGIVVNME